MLLGPPLAEERSSALEESVRRSRAESRDSQQKPPLYAANKLHNVGGERRARSKAPKVYPIDLTPEKIESQRRVLYRKIHTAGKKDYVVEISKTKIKYLSLIHI